MKCANCGAEVKEGSLYCLECGKEVQVVPIYNALEDVYLQGLLDKKSQTKTQKKKEAAKNSGNKAVKKTVGASGNTNAAAKPGTKQTSSSARPGSRQTAGTAKTGAKQTTSSARPGSKQTTGTTKTGTKQTAKKTSKSASAAKDGEKKKTTKRRSNNAAIVFAILLFLCIIGGIAFVGVKITIYQKNASSFDYQMAMAQELLDRNDVAGAMEYYQKALKLDRNRVEPRRELASIYMDQKEYDAALRMYREILKIDPDSVLAYQGMIDLYEEQGMTDKIVEMAQSVTKEELKVLFTDYTVSPPSFSIEPGVYENAIYLELQNTGNSKIYYSLDRTDPVRSGSLYTGRIPMEESGKYEVWAICVTSKGIRSELVTAKYTIDLPGPDMPKVSPDGGEFEVEMRVTVTVPQGCVAFYTWDGTTPTRFSDQYEEPLDVPEGNHVLSVILMDEKTEKFSDVYRGNFVYYP